jgi:hypothetical protein
MMMDAKPTFTVRHLTAEEIAAFQRAVRASLGLSARAPGAVAAGTALQDGLLAYYLSQAKASDANVEARIEREPFDFRDMINRPR